MEQALMSYAEVAELFPGKGARWVRDYLVRPRRVDVVKLGRDRFVVRESLKRLITQSTRRGHVFARISREVADASK